MNGLEDPFYWLFENLSEKIQEYESRNKKMNHLC